MNIKMFKHPFLVVATFEILTIICVHVMIENESKTLFLICVFYVQLLKN